MKVFVVLVEEPVSAIGALISIVVTIWVLTFFFSPPAVHTSQPAKPEGQLDVKRIPSARCSGNPDIPKCEAFQTNFANESPQQAEERRKALENERERNMAIVNDSEALQQEEQRVQTESVGQHSGIESKSWKFIENDGTARLVEYEDIGNDVSSVRFDVTCRVEKCSGYILCAAKINESRCIEDGTLAWRSLQKFPPVNTGQVISVSETIPNEILLNKTVDLYFCMGTTTGCGVERPISRAKNFGPQING